MPIDQAAFCIASGQIEFRLLQFSKSHAAKTFHIEVGRNRRMVPPPSWKPGVCGSTPGAGRGHGVLGEGQGHLRGTGRASVPNFSELQIMMMIDSEAGGQNER